MLASSTSPLPPPLPPLQHRQGDLLIIPMISTSTGRSHWPESRLGSPRPHPLNTYTQTHVTHTYAHAHAHTPGLRRRKGGNTRSRNEGEMGEGGQGSQRGWSHLLTSETGWAQACGTEWTTSSWPLAMSLSLEESREINWPCLLAL